MKRGEGRDKSWRGGGSCLFFDMIGGGSLLKYKMPGGGLNFFIIRSFIKAEK